MRTFGPWSPKHTRALSGATSPSGVATCKGLKRVWISGLRLSSTIGGGGSIGTLIEQGCGVCLLAGSGPATGSIELATWHQVCAFVGLKLRRFFTERGVVHGLLANVKTPEPTSWPWRRTIWATNLRHSGNVECCPVTSTNKAPRLPGPAGRLPASMCGW